MNATVVNSLRRPRESRSKKERSKRERSKRESSKREFRSKKESGSKRERRKRDRSKKERRKREPRRPPLMPGRLAWEKEKDGQLSRLSLHRDHLKALVMNMALSYSKK